MQRIISSACCLCVQNVWRRSLTYHWAHAERAWRFVVLGWLSLTIGLLCFILGFGQNSPLSDEWVFLSELTGEKAVLPWLWESHNEHRFPLPRLIWVGVHRISGYHFRVPMVLSALLVAGISLLLLRSVRRVRGHAAHADLLIPILLLHLGHWENWLIGYQLAFTIPVALVGYIIVVLLEDNALLESTRMLPCGFAISGLVLCGGAGVLLAIPLACGLAIAALHNRSYLAIGLSLLTLAYATGYLYFMRSTTRPETAHHAMPIFATALEFLVCGTGAVGRVTWVLSGMIVAMLYLSIGLRLLCSRSRSQMVNVPQIVGFLVVLAAIAVIGLAIGVSRAGQMPHPGFSSRYGLFSALGLVTLYVVCVRCRFTFDDCRSSIIGCMLALVIMISSIPQAIAYGRYYREATKSMQYRIRAGQSAEDVVSHSVNKVFAGEDTALTRQWMLDGLHVLARHQIGVYRNAHR